jgi:exosortase A
MFTVQQKTNVALLLAALLAWFALFFDAIISAINIWYTSEIFTHGFFIVPGALWIIWSKRQALAATHMAANYWVSILLISVLLVGLLGKVGEINLFQHFACFSSLPLAIWLVIGNKAAKVIWFPLLFMLFSIPVGEELVPTLQQWTAKLAILMLSVTSIPVFVDGLYIEIPQGTFVVAEACSGIRFFVGSVVFGVVYAYYSFWSAKFRLAFVILALLVPVIANAGRVFGLVLIGRYFGMEHATGTDHLVYGWFFFAIVLGLLFLAGEVLRKFEAAPASNPQSYKSIDQNISTKAIAAVLSLFVVSGVWSVASSSNAPKEASLKAVDVPTALSLSGSQDGWAPLVFGHSDQLNISLGSSVNVRAYWYPIDQQGSELSDYRNRLFDKEHWSIVSQKNLSKNNRNFVKTVITSSGGSKRLIYSWYVLEGGLEARASVAKIKQTFGRVFGGSGAGAWVIFSVPFNDGQLERAQELLTSAYDNYADTLEDAFPF